jgi:hypothetical protein
MINPRGKEIAPVKSHKHLGIVLDQALQWHKQANTAIAKATKWILLFCRLANTWRGMRPEQMRWLYMAVAVPKALYAADVWITPPSRLPRAKRASGSTGFVWRLETMQKLATPAIIGAFKNTAMDILNTHTYIPPMELQISKICQCAALQLAAVPEQHPLHKMVNKAAKKQVSTHSTQLHKIFSCFLDAQPGKVETLPSVGRAL